MLAQDGKSQLRIKFEDAVSRVLRSFLKPNFQSARSLPQKNSATVPGPVWEPMVVPT